MFTGLDISTSALVAQRTRLNAIAGNLANGLAGNHSLHNSRRRAGGCFFFHLKTAEFHRVFFLLIRI